MAEPANPNEYDDGAFLDATSALESGISQGVRQLWNAGASWSDIEAEIDNHIENIKDYLV